MEFHLFTSGEDEPALNMCTENLHLGTMKVPKVEDRVQATAAVATSKKVATKHYGADAKAKKLSGETITSESIGPRHRWNDVKIGESVHSYRVLE